jgi:hypothetical protein
MQAARQALRTASHVTKSSVDAIHAPNCYLPASEAPSPLPYIVGGVVTGTAFLLTYKVGPCPSLTRPRVITCESCIFSCLRAI